MVTISALEQFYCEAALATYAGNARYKISSEFPGLKIYEYERPSEFLYQDSYVSSGRRFAGETKLYCHKNGLWLPIWVMQYRGFETTDDKQVTEFLKEALRTAYTKGDSKGGRGPLHYDVAGDLIYYNTLGGYHFDFDGKEEIFNLRFELLFLNEYNGFTLIDLD
jgi:hypothetical protein